MVPFSCRLHFFFLLSGVMLPHVLNYFLPTPITSYHYFKSKYIHLPHLLLSEVVPPSSKINFNINTNDMTLLIAPRTDTHYHLFESFHFIRGWIFQVFKTNIPIFYEFRPASSVRIHSLCITDHFSITVSSSPF